MRTIEIEVVHVRVDFEMRSEDVNRWLANYCVRGCKSIGTGLRSKLPPYETLLVQVDGEVQVDEGWTDRWGRSGLRRVLIDVRKASERFAVLAREIPVPPWNAADHQQVRRLEDALRHRLRWWRARRRRGRYDELANSLTRLQARVALETLEWAAAEAGEVA